MERTVRSFFSLLLAFTMVFTMIPGTLSAKVEAATGDEVDAPFTIGGVDGKYKVTEGAPTSLDETKDHYVIHLTEDAVSNASWTIADDSVGATLFWAGNKVANGWAMGSISNASNTSPQAVRKNDDGVVFATLTNAPPAVFFQNPNLFNQMKGAIMNNVKYYYTVEADYSEGGSSDNQAPQKGSDFSEELRLSQWRDVDLSEKFTDPDGDALTYYMKEDGGSWKETSANFRYYPAGSGSNVVQFKARDTGGKESEILNGTFEVEEPSDTVEVMFSITKGTNKFYETPDTGNVLIPTKLTVPYFDLAEYGLERYYYNPRCYANHVEGDTPYSSAQQPGTADTARGIVTTMHVFIYATEVLYLGYDEEEAGKGISVSDGKFNEAISWTQGAGSSFMSLWEFGTNLNYYLDFGFPLGAPEWGSTSDQQALYGGEDISIHLIEGGAMGSEFGFFTTDGSYDPGSRVLETTVEGGNDLELTLARSISSYGTDTSFDSVDGATLCWCKESEFTANIGDWSLDEFGDNLIDDTDSDGKVTIKTDGVAAGTYYIAAFGGNSGQLERGPVVIKVTVEVEDPAPFTIEGVEDRFRIEKGSALSLDETKDHYVIHLTEEDVANAAWTLKDDSAKGMIYWPGSKVANGWTFKAFGPTDAPQNVRKDDEGAVFATEPNVVPNIIIQNQNMFNQMVNAIKTGVIYYFTVVADYQSDTPEHEHEWGDWEKVDDEQHKRVCALDDSHVETENHTWDEGSETKPATEDEAGEMTYRCTKCDAEKTEEIPKLEHTHEWGDWEKVDDEQHKRVCAKNADHEETENHTWDEGSETKPATEDETGEMTYKCTKCNAEKIEVIPKLPKMYWEISNADELIEFLNEAPADATAVLTDDIDMEGKEWTGKTTFSGSFDGQHHTVKNLNGSTGLFKTVAGASNSKRAEVKHVTVEGTITGSGNVAGIAGTAYFADFSNCVNKAAVSGSYVGGIVGKAQKSMGEGSVSFTNCGNDGDLSGTSVGGIFGYGQSQIVLESCYNKGKITGTGSNDGTVGTGGIGGWVQGYKTGCTMSNIYNNGDVSGNQAVGGLIGSMRNGVTITNGYNSGAITGSSKLGAIAGSAYNATAKATNCYYLDSSCAQAAQGANPSGISATEKTEAELKADDMIGLLGGAFKETDEYPILIWESYTPGAKIYTVTPPVTDGVAFSGAQTASSEEAYVFKITIDKYHKVTDDFAVKINGEPVDPDSTGEKEYNFVVPEPNCDMLITVEGVESTKEALWTGNTLPSPGAYVKSINIYNVEIEEKTVNGTTVDVVLAEGTPLDQLIPFIVEIGGVAGNVPAVTPGTAFEKKLAGGKLTQRINGKTSTGQETTWVINISVKNAPEPESVDVHKPESNKFSITGFDKAVIGSDYVFTVDIDSRHGATDDFQVRVNGEVIQDENGEYTVKNVQEPLTIAVEGVEILTFDHIDAITSDGDKTIVSDHTVVLKGKYDVKMRAGDSGWDVYSGVPYYHVVVPYGTEKVKVAYPTYVWSSTHGQDISQYPPGSYWTCATAITITDNAPVSGTGQNGGVIAYTTENGYKVIELEVKNFYVRENGTGKGFSLIGRTGNGKPGYYGVLTFEVSDCEHKLNKTDEVPATCTVDGTEAYWTCENCEKMFSDESATNVIDEPVPIKAGHVWDEAYTVDKEATCTEEGSKSKHCKNCEEKRDVTVIQKKAHTLTHNEYVQEDCEVDGNKENWECSVCKKHFEDEDCTSEMTDNSWVIPATGHKWIVDDDTDSEGWRVTVEATVGNKGKKERVCANNEGHTEEDDIPEVDTKELEDAIKAAESASEGVKTSEDGSDVDKKDQWVPEEAQKALDKAIEDAKKVAGNPDSKKEDVDEAVKAVSDAADAYEKAKKAGAKADQDKDDDDGKSDDDKKDKKKKSSKDKLGQPRIYTVGAPRAKAVYTSWTKVSKAKKYRLAYRKAGKGWKYKWTGAKRKYDVKKLKRGGLYEFKVAAYKGKVHGKYSNISYRYLKTVSKLKCKAGKKKIVVKWKKVKKAAGYEVFYSTSKTLKNYVRIDTGKKNRCTIKKLEKGKKYYIFVRPNRKYKGNLYKGVLKISKKIKVK